MKNAEYRKVLEFGESGPRRRNKVEEGPSKLEKAQQKLQAAAKMVGKVANQRKARLNDTRQANILMG